LRASAFGPVYPLVQVTRAKYPTPSIDVTEQGEGLADTGVHLVDRVHETLFPKHPLDWQRDIDILAAARWSTMVSLAQIRELTGERAWPEDLAPWMRSDVLEYPSVETCWFSGLPRLGTIADALRP